MAKCLRQIKGAYERIGWRFYRSLVFRKDSAMVLTQKVKRSRRGFLA
jgi:hypothetical protein